MDNLFTQEYSGSDFDSYAATIENYGDLLEASEVAKIEEDAWDGRAAYEEDSWEAWAVYMENRYPEFEDPFACEPW